MIFCSNPVNGGTARIFYETVEKFKTRVSENDRIFACINKGNEVEIYKKIVDIIELPIVSAETLFPDMYGGSLPERVVKSITRNVKYSKVKRNNIDSICRFIRDNHIDSVLIHNGGYVGDDLCNQVLEAAYISRDVSLCRTYVLHNDMKKNFISLCRFRSYDRKISRQATDIVTVSEFTKNRIQNSSFISRDIKVIYDGINVVKQAHSGQLAEKMQLDSTKHNILMIGNFLDNKGQMQFIEAADLLYQKDKDYRFTIIGNVYDSKYYDDCVSLINEKQLQNVFSIHHGINNASDYIDLFDALAVPSMYDESFGLISVEAMANSVPVVAFACGGIPEVVADGRDGFVVPVGDSRAMADKLDWLITHPGERDEMGQNCWEDYLAKFSTEAMVEEYASLMHI